MTTFAFSATVTGLDLDDAEQLDRLFTNELTVQPGQVDDVVSLDVYAEAPSGEHAVQTFIDHLASATPEIRVVRVDPDLVNVPEIADRLAISREMARLLVAGERGDGDFPNHRMIIGNQKVWPWADVFAWALVHGRVDDAATSPIDSACVDWINGCLVPAPRTTAPSEPVAVYFVSTLTSTRLATSWSGGQERRVVPSSSPARTTHYASRSGESFRWSGTTLESLAATA